MALPITDRVTIRGTISSINCQLPWYSQLTLELDNDTSVEYYTRHYRTIRMFYNWYGDRADGKVSIGKNICIDVMISTGELVGFR